MSALAKALELAPLIERVHGAEHSELARVRELTEEISRSGDSATTSRLFGELRVLTDDYSVPSDGCEAFQETYESLKRADEEHTQ